MSFTENFTKSAKLMAPVTTTPDNILCFFFFFFFFFFLLLLLFFSEKEIRLAFVVNHFFDSESFRMKMGIYLLSIILSTSNLIKGKLISSLKYFAFTFSL